MEINPTTTAPTAPPAAQKSRNDENAGNIAGDFQTFLTLLTTQMRNQDPLKPMESTEFVAQLASFSAVEQQVRTNTRLDDIYGALAGGTADGLAAWIGREVRAPVKAEFTGTPIDIGMAPLEGADRAVLVVKNDFGQEVLRKPVSAAGDTLTWDGLDAYGTPLANGSYSFTIDSYSGDVLRNSQAGQVFGKVGEVRIEDGGPVLLMEGGGRVALAEVTAVR